MVTTRHSTERREASELVKRLTARRREVTDRFKEGWTDATRWFSYAGGGDPDYGDGFREAMRSMLDGSTPARVPSPSSGGPRLVDLGMVWFPRGCVDHWQGRYDPVWKGWEYAFPTGGLPPLAGPILEAYQDGHRWAQDHPTGTSPRREVELSAELTSAPNWRIPNKVWKAWPVEYRRRYPHLASTAVPGAAEFTDRCDCPPPVPSGMPTFTVRERQQMTNAVLTGGKGPVVFGGGDV